MYIHNTKPLFAWDCLEDSPSLRVVRHALALIPDGKLLEALRLSRGRGRDDYRVEVLWGVVLLTALLRYTSIELCLGELGRNAGLRELIGIASESGAPKKWNVSRFLESLGRGPHRTLLHEVFDAMAHRLGVIVPDLGESTAGDATALNARRRSEVGAKEESEEGLSQPSGGRKEYTDDGNIAGARRFHAFVGVVMVVHQAFAALLAATPRRHGPLGKMRLGSIQKELQKGSTP